LVKELYIKSKSSLSLQKHHRRSEHWLVTQGKPLITINKDKFIKKPVNKDNCNTLKFLFSLSNNPRIIIPAHINNIENIIKLFRNNPNIKIEIIVATKGPKPLAIG
jgi:hypothetical protein